MEVGGGGGGGGWRGRDRGMEALTIIFLIDTKSPSIAFYDNRNTQIIGSVSQYGEWW